MYVINNRKLFFSISSALVLISVILIGTLGFNPSIEFTGGSIIELAYDGERPAGETVSEALAAIDINNANVQPSEETSLIIRTRPLAETEHKAVLEVLRGLEASAFEEVRFSAIGPSIGKELRSKALTSIILVIVLIILFVAYAFRTTSKEVSSWKYGLVAIIALVHDIVITTGIFVLLGHFFIGFEIDTLFITALLAILGYSVNDTIVVFDRVRENLKDSKKKTNFAETVGKSLRQTIARSINTSATTLIVLLALFFMGGAVTRPFVLALAIGVLAGTYSSIFLASPLLVSLHKPK